MFAFLFSYPGARSVRCFPIRIQCALIRPRGGLDVPLDFCQDPPGRPESGLQPPPFSPPFGSFHVVDHCFPWPGEGTAGLDPEPGVVSVALSRLLENVRAHTPSPFSSGSGPASQLFEGLWGRVEQSQQAVRELGRSLTG